MERTIKSPDRTTIEHSLVDARQYQLVYEKIGDPIKALAWAERVDELLGQWSDLSGSAPTA